MKTYNTYQEAKLAMPLACIIHDTDNDRFFGTPSREGTILTDDGCEFAEAKDHCKTLGWLRANHGFERDGDVIIGHSSGRVIEISHDKIKDYDDKCLVLRAAALENKMNIDNLATQTPEEKEALDTIKSVHLRDYQKADKPHVKVEYEKVTESIFDLRDEFERGELHYNFGDEDWFTFSDEASLVAGFKEGNVYRRIEITETPQQREERERLEAAYDLYCTGNKGLNVTAPCAFDEFKSDEVQCKFWLAIVDKTNYRKESN